MQNNSFKITVVGIGGWVQKVIDDLNLRNKSKNINFALINSDKNFLEQGKTAKKLLIYGENKNLYGLGCGGNPETGKEYAEFCIDKIEEIFEDTDFAFLISCFGGGCGTGATPIIAKMLRKKGIKTLALITTPFNFEGKLREKRATEGVQKMQELNTKLVATNNDQILYETPQCTSLAKAFNYSDKKLIRYFYIGIELLYEGFCLFDL